MKYLLDTNILIWLFSGEKEKIYQDISPIINDDKNEIYYSIVSIWEVAIKHLKNPLKMPVSPENLVKMCNKVGFAIKELTLDTIFALEKLRLSDDAPVDHKDPFDRILMAQAKGEKMTFITGDSTLKWYNEKKMIFVNKG